MKQKRYRSKRSVFLASIEQKDYDCLHPLADALKAYFAEVYIFDIIAAADRQDQVFERFLSVSRPLVVTAYTGAADIINLLRSPPTMTTFAVDHGFAPFKQYSYSQAFFGSNFYIAPTPLMRDRLATLFPDKRGQLRLGGYPRLSSMKEQIDIIDCSGKACAEPRLKGWLSANDRTLVITSWGVRPEQLMKMPDRENILYLLHPADARNESVTRFQSATVLVSSRELTPSIIHAASRIFGDFSSLTLECLWLGKQSHFFLARELYVEKYDIPDSFFDFSDPAFAAFPHSSLVINREQVLDWRQLVSALEDSQSSAPLMDVPMEVLPPRDEDNRTLCARTIFETALEGTDTAKWEACVQKPGSTGEIAKMVIGAYKMFLNRRPDPNGFAHYLRSFGAPDNVEMTAEKILAMMQVIYSSPEAKSKREKMK